MATPALADGKSQAEARLGNGPARERDPGECGRFLAAEQCARTVLGTTNYRRAIAGRDGRQARETKQPELLRELWQRWVTILV